MKKEAILNIVVIIFLIFGSIINLSKTFYGLGIIVALIYLGFIIIWFSRDRQDASMIIASYSIISIIASVILQRYDMRLIIDLCLVVNMCIYLLSNQIAENKEKQKIPYSF